MSKINIAIDSQKLETIQLCPRKFYYNFQRNLVPEVTKNYFERGSLLHHMLAEYYTAQTNHNVVEVSSGIKLYKDAIPRQHALEYAIEEGYKYSVELALDNDDIANTIQNFHHYCLNYIDDRWTPQFTEKVAARVIFEDDHFCFIYQGKIDLGVTIPGVTGIIPVDHKSVKRRGTEMDLSNQFMGYCWLLGTNNLVKNEIGFQKTLDVKDRMRRIMFSYSKARIDEWVGNSISWIKQLIYCIESDNWLMNLSSCNKFDGCHYAALCMSSPEDRERKMDRLYKVREEIWDVGVALENKI